MSRLPEPCLCGAPDCRWCNPSGYTFEQDLAWICDYFPGDMCDGCKHCKTHNNEESICEILDGADSGPCPALEREQKKIEGDESYD